MQVLLRKKYLDEYDLKAVVKAVTNLFDDYYYKKFIAKGYYEASLKNNISYNPENRKHHKKTDKTLDSVTKKEMLDKYLTQFDEKLSCLLNTLTDEEMKIYKYSILAREQDKVIRDRICKTDKTYYPIKKSCYVKLALGFDLVDGYSKNIFTTISLID